MDPEGNVRYVVAGNPTGWAAMAKTIRGVDEDKVKDHKEDIDTLLVFTGLFSAVLTAFVIESYQSLSPDKQDTIIHLLGQISNRTTSYTVTSGLINSTVPDASQTQPPFEPPLSAVRVNQLWFASLIVTLITASFAMLVKQWLREYLAVDYTSPHERLRARQFRHPGLSDWKVFEIAGVLPLLLQMALGLFLLGLCFFTWSVNSSVGTTNTVLVAAWAFLLVSAIVAPVSSPRCPYKTALLKGVVVAIRRRVVVPLWRQFMIPLRRRISSFILSTSLHTGLRETLQAATLGILRDSDQVQSGFSHDQDFLEEEDAVKQDTDELTILKEVDAFLLDDELLGTTMFESLTQFHEDPASVITFILNALNNRLNGNIPKQHLTSILDLRQLSRRGWMAVSDIVANTVVHSLGREAPGGIDKWLEEAIYLLLSISDHPLTHNARNAIVQCAQSSTLSHFGDVLASLATSSSIGISRLRDILVPLSPHLSQLLSSRAITPPDVIGFVLRIHAVETGCNTSVPLSSILDLRSLSRAVWDFTSDVLGSAVLAAVETYEQDKQIGPWLEDAVRILLSASHYPLTPTGIKALVGLFKDAKTFWARFRNCLRLLASPQSAGFPDVLSRLRELGDHVANDSPMTWLLREIVQSVPCTPQCSHPRPNPSLRSLFHDHVPPHPWWARHYLPLLVDRIDGISAAMSTWPPGATLSLFALLSCPVPLRSIHADAPTTLFKIFSSLISSPAAMEPLSSVDPLHRSRVRENVAISNILSLVAEADSEGRGEFLRALHVFCGKYSNPAIRSKLRWFTECNLVRIASLASKVHSRIQEDAHLSGDWRKCHAECAKAMQLFRKDKFPTVSDDEKGHTARLAEECLETLSALEQAAQESDFDFDEWESSFDAKASALPDDIFQQLAEFVPEQVAIRFRRVKRLRKAGVGRSPGPTAPAGTGKN